MHKAGGIIAIIAGIFGIFAAGFTLLFGGLASAFKADGGSTVVALGWGGVVFSFLTIIFGAMALSRVRWAGIGIIICAIGGAILGGTLVAVFMALSLIGGVLTLFAKTPNHAIQAPTHDTSIGTPLPSTQSISTLSNEVPHQSTFPHAITATRPKKTQTLLIVSGMLILTLLAGTIAYFSGVKQKDTSPNVANQTASSAVQKSTIAQSGTTRNIRTETPQRDEAGLRKCLYNAGDRTPPYSFALSGITLVEKNACDDWLKTNPLVDVFVETKSVEGRDGKYLIKSTDNLLQESTINFNLHVITDTDEEKYIAENLKTFTRIKARGTLIYEKGAKEYTLNPAYLIPNKYNIVEKTSPTVEDNSAKNVQTTQLPTPPVTPNQPLSNSIYRVCNLDGNGEKFLALKDGPNASSERVTKMTEGTELSMLEKNGDWYQVKMADGKIGWAHSKWLCQSNGQSAVTVKTPSTASSNQSIAPSFNCLNASTKVEKMICNSEELSKLDAQLSVVYKATLSVDPEKELLKKYQDNWRKNIRDVCSIESCVKSAYKNRIAELK